MICDSSRSVVPRAMSERIKRSNETDGSPASILATRDWLDSSFAARSSCDRPFRCRLCLKPAASLIFNSMYAASSSERPKNSLMEPTFQPFARKRFAFAYALSYSLSRLLHTSTIALGVVLLFLLKTSKITMASESISHLCNCMSHLTCRPRRLTPSPVQR
jgi:hypothetical protein